MFNFNATHVKVKGLFYFTIGFSVKQAILIIENNGKSRNYLTSNRTDSVRHKTDTFNRGRIRKSYQRRIECLPSEFKAIHSSSFPENAAAETASQIIVNISLRHFYFIGFASKNPYCITIACIDQ